MNHPRSSARNGAAGRKQSAGTPGNQPSASSTNRKGSAGAQPHRAENTAGHSNESAAARPDSPGILPATIRRAGWYGLAEGVLGIIAAVVMIIDAATGRGDDQSEIGGVWASWGNGYGTALWFIVIFGGVGVAGWGLTRGKRWGRAPVAMLNMLLLPVAWYMYSSSRPELAIPTVIIALIGLVLLFNPAAVNWAASKYGD